MFPILFALLAILFPIGIYLLILANFNRRPNPVMVSGAWDFAGVLFAVSGFLLFVGPSLLTGFNYHWPDFWLQLNFRSLKGLKSQWSLVWMFLWYFYFAVVLGASVVLLLQRRRVTSIYNIEARALMDRLSSVFDRMGLGWNRVGNRFIIKLSRRETDLVQIEPALAGPGALAHNAVRLDSPHFAPEPYVGSPADHRNGESVQSNGRRLVLEVEPFAILRHVTLHWPVEGGLIRQEIEEELANDLSQVDIPRNPVGTWLLWLAAVLFVGLFCLTVLLQFIRIRAESL